MATQILVDAVNKEPLNWAAWIELARLVTDKETVSVEISFLNLSQLEKDSSCPTAFYPLTYS